MPDGAALLRMLEPAVRPVQSPASRPAGAAHAINDAASPFETLLSEASRAPASVDEPAQETQAGEAASADVNALTPLSQLERVENASLRRMMV